MNRFFSLFLIISFFISIEVSSNARNIDLVTLPPRAGVQLTIYNSEDLTLVKETRAITFKKGTNRLQFSWANTLIDPTSVYFKPLEHDDEIEVKDTTFPNDRPQLLIWNIESSFEGMAKVEVSYFTSGISWKADYVMITNPEETNMAFDGYVTVVNHSGEDYEGAQVRLVVGVVNLVEKIAQLSQIAPAQEIFPTSQNVISLRNKAMSQALNEAEGSYIPAPSLSAGAAPPKVIKEGLSEYFIFSVEGSQTIPNGWSQRMVSFRTQKVPFDILYRYRLHQYGERPIRFFILANDKEHQLGESPLPDGVIRVFRENGHDGLAYYVTQNTKYIPLQEKIELNLGTDNQIVYKRDVFGILRHTFVFGGDDPHIIGWDETRKWQEEIRNYRDKPIKIEFRHVLKGDVEFSQENPVPSLYDFQTVEYSIDISANKQLKWISEGTFHFGTNCKQERVRIK